MDSYDEVTIHVNGKKYKAAPAAKFAPNEATLNRFLREELLLTGTKKMCEEGGCGVCTVVRKTTGSVDDEEHYLALNSCLIPLYACQNWEIFTIEGLGSSIDRHQIQDRLMAFNGSQCGFCTPGMIMNMYALQRGETSLKAATVEGAFAGNLCRCTGYRSILAAFKSLCHDASPDLRLPDIEDVRPCNGANFSAARPPPERISLTTDNRPAVPIRPSTSPFHFLFPGGTWIRLYEFNELLQVMKTFNGPQQTCVLIAGNTAKGVYKDKTVADVYVDISNIAELRARKINENFLVVGANVTLSDATKTFRELSMAHEGFEYLNGIANHFELVATVPIRNIGTLAGNLMIKHRHKEFPSDVFLLLETCAAKLKIVDAEEREYFTDPSDFVRTPMTGRIVKEIWLPKIDKTTHKFDSYKIMPRSQNAHALQNAGFLIELESDRVRSARIVYGHVSKSFIRAHQTEEFLRGKPLFDNGTLRGAFERLDEELACEHSPPEPHPDFRKRLAISLFYKFVISIAPEGRVSKRHLSGGALLYRPVSTATQDYDTKECLYPLARGTAKVEAKYQVTGEAKYVMDQPNYPDQFFAAFVLSKIRPGSTIIKINPQKALKLKGVVAFFDKTSIPGKNTFTPLEGCLFTFNPTEEEVFCGGTVKYYSQPIGVIVAESHEIAQEASELVEVEYRLASRKPIITIEDALKSGDASRLQQEPTTEETNVRVAEGTKTIEGTFGMSWQYHYHMETQCCSAVPNEDGIDVYPASQWMDLVQNTVAVVLNIPANKVNVSVKRLGGGFGAKIVRSSLIAGATALASYLLKRPVKMWLPLSTNMRAIGKRNPMSGKYKVSVDPEGIVRGLESTIHHDHGNGNNEMIQFLFLDIYKAVYDHSTWRTDSGVVFTDTPASCYTRAPGTAEGVAFIEAIMEHAATELGMDPLEFKMKNFSKDNGKLLEHVNDFVQWADIAARKRRIEEYNQNNKWRKRGLAVVPMVYPFPLFFGYGVIVSIYHADGTVAVAHGGVEMGQGINTKVVETCAFKLGIAVDKVTVKPSNNLIAPNASMTGASITSEAVCWGVMKACDVLLERMEPIKKKLLPATPWERLVKECYKEYVELCATSMFQATKETSLAPYKIYGVCASEVELDTLTGQYQIERVDLLEDVGDSMNPRIDIGQVEGAFVMGLGYFCTEQITVNEEGEILTDRSWNYKPPGARDIPVDFRIKFPKNNPNHCGVLKSKAVGEPPLCLAVSVPLAVRRAVAAARTEHDRSPSKWYCFDGPSTVEQTYMNCLHHYRDYLL